MRRTSLHKEQLVELSCQSVRQNLQQFVEHVLAGLALRFANDSVQRRDGRLQNSLFAKELPGAHTELTPLLQPTTFCEEKLFTSGPLSIPK